MNVSRICQDDMNVEMPCHCVVCECFEEKSLGIKHGWGDFWMACLLVLRELFDACVDWEWCWTCSCLVFLWGDCVFLPSCLVKTFAVFQLYQANLRVYNMMITVRYNEWWSCCYAYYIFNFRYISKEYHIQESDMNSDKPSCPLKYVDFQGFPLRVSEVRHEKIGVDSESHSIYSAKS